MPPKKKPKVKKPRVAQKQKQRQSVVVNIGTDLIKKKRKYTRKPKVPTSSALVRSGGGGGQTQEFARVVYPPRAIENELLSAEDKALLKFLHSGGKKDNLQPQAPQLLTAQAPELPAEQGPTPQQLLLQQMIDYSKRKRAATPSIGKRVSRTSSLPPMSRATSEQVEIPVFGVATSTPVVTTPLGSTTTADVVQREIPKPVLGGQAEEMESPEPTRGRTKKGRPALTAEQKAENKRLADEKRKAFKLQEAKDTEDARIAFREKQMMRANDIPEPREIGSKPDILGGSRF